MCLSCLSLGRESWGNTRELLVFNICGNPKEPGTYTSKGIPSNKVDELPRDSESKQAKSRSFLLPCPCQWAATRRWPRLRMNLPTSNDLIKNNSSQVGPVVWVLAYCRCSHVDNHHSRPKAVMWSSWNGQQIQKSLAIHQRRGSDLGDCPTLCMWATFYVHFNI